MGVAVWWGGAALERPDVMPLAYHDVGSQPLHFLILLHIPIIWNIGWILIMLPLQAIGLLHFLTMGFGVSGCVGGGGTVGISLSVSLILNFQKIFQTNQVFSQLSYYKLLVIKAQNQEMQ